MSCDGGKGKARMMYEVKSSESGEKKIKIFFREGGCDLKLKCPLLSERGIQKQGRYKQKEG